MGCISEKHLHKEPDTKLLNINQLLYNITLLTPFFSVFAKCTFAYNYISWNEIYVHQKKKYPLSSKKQICVKRITIVYVLLSVWHLKDARNSFNLIRGHIFVKILTSKMTMVARKLQQWLRVFPMNVNVSLLFLGKRRRRRRQQILHSAW